MRHDAVCAVTGCNKVARKAGWCPMHYQRWRRKGDLFSVKSKAANGEPQRYLAEVVMPYQGSDCLIWPFGRLGNGYAMVNLPGRSSVVSRIVCETIHGLGDPALDAAHTCGNGHGGCVNPHHLVWKTRTENMADTLLHGTRRRGERNPRVKLTADAVREIRTMRLSFTQQAIADKFGVSRLTVSSILNGKRWGWLS